VAAGRPLDPQLETPPEWREYTRARTDMSAPERMTDGAGAAFVPFTSGYDPANAVDRAIMATRAAVFPWHGLFPSP
jgi:acetoin utilization protein AcuC